MRQMKTYPIIDAEGNVAAFHVDSVPIGKRGACKVVRSIPGATITRGPGLFSWLGEMVFCEFEVNGRRFEIEEPFGDNDRYWVGPAGLAAPGATLQWVPEIELVRAAFERR
jgi:hypothetical protein